MNAPSEIIDALESIIFIFFSETPHKERTTFILCDNLAELCCKKRMMEKNITFDKYTKFHQSLEKTKVPLKLSKRLNERHTLRNEMQHTKAIITVNGKQCADFIIDIKYLIEKFWTKYALAFIDEWVTCALRIAKLYSSKGDLQLLKRFELLIFSEVDWREIDTEMKIISGKMKVMNFFKVMSLFKLTNQNILNPN